MGAQQGKPYERTRAPRQGFIGLTREEIIARLEADDSNDGGTGPGDGGVGEPDTSFDFEADGPTLYEQNPQDDAEIEKQRAAIARMKEPGRTWASAELDYIVAGRNGTPPDNGTTTAAQRERVMAVLLKAGFPDPGYRVGPDGELRFEKLKTKTAKEAAKKGKGKSKLTIAERIDLRRQLQGFGPKGRGTLYQFPTPEESLRAAEALQVFLDYVREKGAKPVDDRDIKADLREGDVQANSSRGSGDRMEAARSANDIITEGFGLEGTFQEGPASELGEGHFRYVNDASQRAALNASRPKDPEALASDNIDRIPASKSLPGQAEIEAYLAQVNASKTRLFQETAETKKALALARDIAVALGEANADRLFATDNVGDAKGWTQLAREGIDRVFRVALVQKADKSTFLHESAHVFLELFADLAERADAPKSVLDDWQTTLKWLGVEGREGIKREQHEKWAKAWEFYLAKGEYPADRLAGAFQRFRLWMMAVYKQLSEVGGEINEDIKGVFDRLLATDAEIDASKARMGLKALPREALGLDAVAYAEYLDEMQRATSTAAQLADHQVAKDQLRATEDWWKSALAEEKKKAAEAYENLPARRAQLLLQGKPAGDFLGIKEPLNKADVVAMVGEQHAKKFKTSKDGVRPDDIVAMAEGLLGYATGKEMLEAVLKVPEKDVWVDLVADNAVREQFPGVIEERTRLRDLVAQGLHGTATKAWVLKEFKALNARVSQKPGEMPPAEVLKRAAEIAAGGRPAGRLQARDAQVAERQAANNAAEAAAKGNFAQAAVFKRQQLLNMYLFDALTKAKKEVEAFEEKGRQLSKTAARQRLGKADPKYRDAVDTILGTFDVAEPEPGLTKSLDAVLQEVEKLMAEDQTPVAFDRGLLVDRASTRGLRGWRELPLEDVRHIMRALQNIEAAARNRSTVLIDDKRADLAEVVEGLSKEAGLLDARPPDPTPEAATAGQWFGKQWTALDGALLKPETLSRFLSGTADTTEFLKSWWFRAIVAPMQRAKVRELDLGREVLKPLVEAFERIPNSGRQMEKVDSAKLFPDHVSVEKPQRRFEILMMLLHTGNQSNLDRLTKGRGITEEQVRQAAVHVGITKEEYDWVQLVWDTAEKLKPLAFDLEEKHTGVRPEAITPRPFQTPFGEYAGGYFPAVYSPASGVGARQEAQLAQFKDPNVNRPSTTHNYLKSRVEDFSDIISLSPSSITRHFALVLHDVAFREAVQSVGGILSNQAVRDVMRERVGDGRAKQLLQWVGDVAQMRGLEGFDKSGGLARLAMWMRGNFVTSVLGYKVPNALEDFTTNLTSSFNASDLKPQHLAAGLAEFYATGKNSYQMALGKSGELRARRKQVQRELAKGVKDLTASGVGKLLSTGPIGWYKEHAFAFQEFTEYATATPIWIGAYRQALGEEKSEADAVAFADAIVRQVVVSHNPVDLSALMRDKGPIGYLTMFFGAFNHFYNQFRTLGHDFAEADTLKTRATKAGKMMGLATGIFLIGSLVRGKGPDKDEEEWEWALRKVFLDGLMQMVPLVNVAGKVGDRALTKKQLPARDNSLFGLTERMGESMLKLAKDDTTDAARMKAFLDLVGPLAGLPTAGPTQVYDALMNWALGPEQAN